AQPPRHVGQQDERLGADRAYLCDAVEQWLQIELVGRGAAILQAPVDPHGRRMHRRERRDVATGIPDDAGEVPIPRSDAVRDVGPHRLVWRREWRGGRRGRWRGCRTDRCAPWFRMARWKLVTSRQTARYERGNDHDTTDPHLATPPFRFANRALSTACARDVK